MIKETIIETRFFENDEVFADINYCFEDKKYEFSIKSTMEYSKKEITELLESMLKFVKQVKK